MSCKIFKRKSIIFLLASCLLIFSRLSAQSEEYTRTVEILGWAESGNRLIFREDTRADNQFWSRAVILDPSTRKILKELAIQNPQDGPDLVSVRENNLTVLLNTEGYVAGQPGLYFISANKRGFFSPDGKYLITGDIHFGRGSGKKNQQQVLTLSLSYEDLRSGDSHEFARAEIDNLDGEHYFDENSVGNVQLADLEWSPNGKLLAAILEQRELDTFIRGVIALPSAAFETLQPPPKTSEPPAAKTDPAAKSTPTSLGGTKGITDASDLAPLEQYYTPAAGTPIGLTRETVQSVRSSDDKWIAAHQVIQTCKAVPVYLNQIAVYDPIKQQVWEVPLGMDLNPDKLRLRWDADTLKILMLDEPLKSFSPKGKKWRSVSRPQRGYALQVASFEKEAAAVAEVEKLCIQGVAAYYLRNTGSEKSGYRVRIGRFKDAQSAMEYGKFHLAGKYPGLFATSY